MHSVGAGQWRGDFDEAVRDFEIESRWFRPVATGRSSSEFLAVYDRVADQGDVLRVALGRSARAVREVLEVHRPRPGRFPLGAGRAAHPRQREEAPTESARAAVLGGPGPSSQGPQVPRSARRIARSSARVVAETAGRGRGVPAPRGRTGAQVQRTRLRRVVAVRAHVDTHLGVSVGLPVYNGERYIEESVRSVLAQTFADFELIISDNGSTDSTVGIVEKLAAEDDRIVSCCSREPRCGLELQRGVRCGARRVLPMARARRPARARAARPARRRARRRPDGGPRALVDDGSSTTSVCQSRVFEDDLGADADPHRNGGCRTSSAGSRYCNPVFGLVRRAALERTALIASFPGPT